MPRQSRRQFLRLGAATGFTGLSGCLSAFQLGPGCTEGRSIHESDVPLDQAASWPTFQYDRQNTGHNTEATSPKSGVETAWRFGTCQRLEPGIVIHAGKAVIDGTILDARTGQLAGEWSGNSSTPAVVGETLYVGSNDLEARDLATGERRWTFETDGNAGALPSPTVMGGTIFVPGNIRDEKLYAVDSDAGTEKWRFPTGGDIGGSPAVIGDTVFVVDDSVAVYAIDTESGELRWSRGFDTDLWRTSPVIDDEIMYLGSWDGDVLALSIEDGAIHWRTTIDTPGFRIGGPVAVAEGIVIAAGRAGTIAALDGDTGEALWKRRTGVYELTTPTVADGAVFTGVHPMGNAGTVFAFDLADGTILWRFETRSRETGETRLSGIVHGPTLVDELVYVATDAGDVYALHGT